MGEATDLREKADRAAGVICMAGSFRAKASWQARRLPASLILVLMLRGQDKA